MIDWLNQSPRKNRELFLVILGSDRGIPVCLRFPSLKGNKKIKSNQNCHQDNRSGHSTLKMSFDSPTTEWSLLLSYVYPLMVLQTINFPRQETIFRSHESQPPRRVSSSSPDSAWTSSIPPLLRPHLRSSVYLLSLLIDYRLYHSLYPFPPDSIATFSATAVGPEAIS